MVQLGFFPSSYAVASEMRLGFEPTSVSRVAPDWNLWRTLYWLSYRAAANKIVIDSFGSKTSGRILPRHGSGIPGAAGD